MWRAGIEACGDIAESVRRDDESQFGDYCVGWGPRLKEDASRKGLAFVMMECGFLGDRLDNFYVGSGGLNGDGHLLGKMIPNRGVPWYHHLAPMKNPKQHKRVLLLGQVAHDASLMPLSHDAVGRPSRYTQWLSGVAQLALGRGCELGFRGHPSEPIYTRPHQCDEARTFETKEEAFDWADLCIAFSSNSLVEAFIFGCDVMPGHPTSLTWDMRVNWDSTRRFGIGDRRRWLDRVATYQWSSEEIKTGEAWRHLTGRI